MSTTWDVVVVGAGTAGLPCAIFAAKRGAKVCVIETADKIGGSLWLASGQISGTRTKLQAKRGIADDPDQHFADFMRINHGTGDHAFMRLFADNAGATVDWLYDIGWRPQDDHPAITYGHEIYTTPRTYWSKDGGLGLANALAPVFEAEVKKGNITLKLNTRMSEVIVDDTGAAVGVRATRGGTAEEIKGKNIVLTCGGYAASAELWGKVHNRPVRGHFWPHSQGDGVKAAMNLGAEFKWAENFIPTFAGTSDPDAGETKWINTICVPQIRMPWEIYVNLDGERFIAEDNPSVDMRERALMKQPDMAFWSIYDAAIAGQAPPLLFAWPKDKQERAFATHPDYRTAETLDGLAALTGLSAAALRHTVERYNQGQAVKSDAFGRQFMPLPLAKGPYYAVKHYAISVVSFGGIATDLNCRVLRPNGRPIAGLYAAGEMVGFGRFGNAYLSGTSIGPAITFGRLLGDRILAWNTNQAKAAE
jgi:fumarate reductase flavoprotein subunit